MSKRDNGVELNEIGTRQRNNNEDNDENVLLHRESHQEGQNENYKETTLSRFLSSINVMNVVMFFVINFAIVFYVLSLDGCYDTQAHCLVNLNPSFFHRIMYFLLLCGFFIAFSVFLYFRGLISKWILIYVGVIMFYLTEYYDTGSTLAYHGSYNKIVFWVLFSASLVVIYWINFIYYLYTRGYLRYILASFGLFILLLIVLQIKLNDSCKLWNYGFNEEKIDNEKYPTCKVQTPSHCWTEMLDGLLDISWLLSEQCEISFRDGEIDELFKFIPKSAQVGDTLAYPDSTKFSFIPESYHIQLFFNIMQRMKPINNTVNLAESDLEVFLKYNITSKLGRIEMQVKRNDTLVKERNEQFKKSNKTETEIKNLFIIYIDSISRSHFFRKMKKTTAFLNKHINEEKNLSAYHFLKYHAFIYWTQPNVYPMFYGQSFYNKTGEDIVRHFHENNFITAHSNNMCEKILFDIIEGDDYMDDVKMIHFDHENIALFCDPNYFNPENPYTPYFGPYSIKRKCLYGKDTFEYVFEYGEKFWEAYKNERKFLRMAFQDAHEGTGEVSRYLDEKLGPFLESFEKKGWLDDTAVMIVSDHGCNMIGVYNIFQVEDFVKEKTLPYLSIILPKNSKLNQKYRDNLNYNKNVMVTPYDVFNTLLDLIDVDKSVYSPNGKSLFTRIPETDRSCKNYGFDMKELWCRCEEESN